ncbi:hypothetical protein Gotur_017236 [Gossypium turneri]
MLRRWKNLMTTSFVVCLIILQVVNPMSMLSWLKVQSIEKFGFKNFPKVKDIDVLMWCSTKYALG